MPVNQINAPIYLKVRYQTPAAAHSLRFYFETGATFTSPSALEAADWSVNNSSNTTNTNVTDIVSNTFARFGGYIPEGTSVTSIEVWQSAEGQNVYLGNNALPVASTFGVGWGIASAYVMWVFSSATRQQFRLEVFDGFAVNPQQYSGGSAPLIDDGTIRWYMTRGNVPFATQDGHRLTSERSRNVGYNRRLAKAYGRRIAP